MTLLKVLYFAHGWHLAKYGQPLVAQPFEAWQHGPVNRVVYDQLKTYGAKPIDKCLQSFDVKSCGFVQTRVFVGELAEFLNNIFDYYSRFHPFTLSDLTHAEGSPWDAISHAARTSAVPGMIIPDLLISEWFKEGMNGYNTMELKSKVSGTSGP